MEWDPSSLPDLLPIYYKKLFPYKTYCKWLQYDEKISYFKNREFSFTLKDDIYLRYRSYSDQQEFEKDLRGKCPYKIDIGAVYTCSPKMRDMVRAGEFVARYKELVFDIDMTDYDDVRLCCSGAEICLKCWPLMTVAMEVVDKALEEDFGFKHRLWVYSGRRGIHCWVCDKRARQLDSSTRSAIADFLTVIKGGAGSRKKVHWTRDMDHPSISRAKETVKKYIKTYMLEQGYMGEEKFAQIVDLFCDDQMKSSIKEILSKISTPITDQHRSEALHGYFNKYSHNCYNELMFQFMYPRLDANVSKGVNHLLKSPFCIHPKTGRVCVPIDTEKAKQFDPFKVPTLQQVIEELSSYSGDAKLLDYKKTSIRDSVKYFQQFLENMCPPETENLKIKSEQMETDALNKENSVP